MRKRITGMIKSPQFAFVSGVCSILGVLFTVILPSMITRLIALAFLFIYIISVTVYIVCRYFSTKRISKNINTIYNWKLENNLNHVHLCSQKILECMLEIDEKEPPQEALFKYMCISICDLVGEAIATVFSKNVCVCIKEISANTLMSEDIDAWKTKTTARNSKALHRQAFDREPQLISENTSFYEIIKSSCDAWAARDLAQIIKDYEGMNKQYKNPNPKYAEMYNSTIVVPISTKTSLVSRVITMIAPVGPNPAYHYFGFLCIDSEDSFLDADPAFNEILLFVKSVAQLLYPFFEKKLIAEINSL